MRIRMQLLSDAIFGNGMSVPGGEDLSVLTDEYGFPYYKGGTFKGVFREALEQYLFWTVLRESRNNLRSVQEQTRCLEKKETMQRKIRGSWCFPIFSCPIMSNSVCWQKQIRTARATNRKSLTP